MPIAAPSANKFGHVSPTEAKHVFDDLKNYEDLIILDDNSKCAIGIESTVIKLCEEGDIKILRPGAISSFQIQTELEMNNIYCKIENIKRKVDEKSLESLESPGQLLTHYAPNIETFILTKQEFLDENIIEKSKEILARCILIDFFNLHIDFKNIVNGYFNLSPEGDIEEAFRNVFSFLRKKQKNLVLKIY